jgi:RimJ/RimL family protein N-acetyltransferase
VVAKEPRMKYFRKMIGKRCYLSPMNPEDAQKYVAWLADMEVAQYLTVACHIISLYVERQTLERFVRQGDHFAIVDSKNDELLGGCGLLNPDHINRNAEVGIFIGEKSYWNKGYGEEAMRLLLDYAFNILDLNNIMLNVYAYNTRAIRCYRKIGFKEIGRRRQAKRIQGRSYDIIFMDILAEEFTGSSLPVLPNP